MPWEEANGLLPGRPPGRGIPCEDANGLLPGRAPPGRGPGRLAPGLGAPPGLGAGAASALGLAAGLGAPGFGAFERAPGLGAAPGFAAGASVLAFGFGAGLSASAFGAGFGSALALGSAAFFGAGLRGAGFLAAAFDSDASSPFFFPAFGNAARTRRATGASIVEDALVTNSPMSLSFARTSLLGIPSSLASSWTRSLATILLSRPRRAGAVH